MGNPHVLVVPLPAQGHVIPLLELSKRLAQHGFKITFVNTEYNQNRILNGNGMKEQIGDHQIRLVSIPDGIETLEDRKRPGTLCRAILNVLPEKLEELIEQIHGSSGEEITCVLVDSSMGWALGIAEKKGIRGAVFCPVAAASLIFELSIPKLIEDGIISDDGAIIKKQIIQLSPTMPVVSEENFVWTRLAPPTLQKLFFELLERNRKHVKATEWLLCNSSYDLEPGAFTLSPNILPIGPLSASNQLEGSAGSFWSEDTTCMKWLDQQSPGSVIYVAFGSIAIFNPTQFQELALGLELCNRPFLWAVRPGLTDGTCPKEFHDRIASRGRVVEWTAQQKILSHPSVACFISHCGWNSTVEGVSNGTPFLCWPCSTDQFLNRTYICDFWKVGLGLELDERGIVTQEEIVSKVEKLLGDEELRARALDLKNTVNTCIKNGGRSNNNLKNFVEWMKG